MVNILQGQRALKIFLFYLYYVWIYSFFINQYLFIQKFNTIIFIALIPALISDDYFNIKKFKSLFFIFFMNFILLIYYLFEFSTFLNLLSIISSFLFFSLLAFQLVKYYELKELIQIIKKHTVIIFFVSLFLTTLLTMMDYPYIINYYFWETITQNYRLKLLSSEVGGHSSAIFLLPILLSIIHYDLFTKNEKIKSFIYFCVIAYFCLLTKSRVGYFSVILISLSSFIYLNSTVFKKFYTIFLVSIGFFFIIVSSTPKFFFANSQNVFLDLIISADKTRESTSDSRQDFFSGRHILNQYLIRKIQEKPLLGVGHNSELQSFGLTKDGNIAYDKDSKSVGRESLLIISFKYGLPYLISIILFLILIPFNLKKSNSKEFPLLQNIWLSLYLIIISSGSFTTLYGSSGFVFLFLSILYFIPKIK
tara:strand:+ start:166 stop:1428 length:1263 start_codon:yes stop_codon:yes gene_type:complete